MKKFGADILPITSYNDQEHQMNEVDDQVVDWVIGAFFCGVIFASIIGFFLIWAWFHLRII